jgi:citrate lyase subunit beta / citryl-CoA lyase
VQAFGTHADATDVTRFRSLLFVPANRPDLAAKAPRCGPQAVILDLEDAVPENDKVAARAGLSEAAALLAEAGVPVLARVNPQATPWFSDDLDCLPADLLAGVVVPKLDSATDAGAVIDRLGAVPVVAGLETVRGVADARALLEGPVSGCYFGAEDYVVDLGGVRTDGNAEVAVARALVAMAARLAGVPAYDMVVLAFGDKERFVAEAAGARALGYAGKICIHPLQVPLANEAFLPTREEVDRARRLLAAFDAAVAGGRASVAFDGTMVDEVVARQARAVLEVATGR